MNTIHTILQEIATRAPKESLYSPSDSYLRARADTRIICGDFTVYEVSTLGFSDDASVGDILNSAAGKQALYRELCAIWKV